MKSGATVFLGSFAAMSASWCLMILFPNLQIGDQTDVVIDASTGDFYPSARPGMAGQGKEVYRRNGCFYCHSQQVHAKWGAPGMQKWVGSDIDRGWGKRWSVAQDYLNDVPVMAGRRRIGPDLANIGVRKGDDVGHTNVMWHLVHLYNPQIHSSGSVMPSYSYLFTEQKIVGSGSPDALQLTGGFAPAKGYEVVPKPEALTLVQYLFSLRQDVPLYEAPYPFVPKPKTDTNAPAGGTNGTNAAVAPAKK